MNPPDRFVDALRETLSFLYDPHILRNSPLLAYLGSDPAARTPTALREMLVAAIESFKPGAGVPAQSREARIYELLLYRYVQQFSQKEVADQLGISVRHLRREQTLALEALGARLMERFPGQIATLHPQVAPVEAAGEAHPPLGEELAWLRETPPEKPTNLYQELPAVVALAQPLAQRHDVDLHLVLEDGLVEAVVHPVAVRQILLSVLNAAIQAEPARRVVVSARPRETEVEVRLRCAVQGPPAGAGQGGLGMAQRLAHLAGCAVHVTSTDTVLDVVVLLPALGQLPVLVIDDNVDTLALFQRYASGTRYRLITLREPAQAVQVVQHVGPRMIVLDIMMPQIDGWEVLGQLLQHPEAEQIPVVVCSIMDQEELALTLGASGYLQKPVSRQAFLAMLDRQVALSAPECV